MKKIFKLDNYILDFFRTKVRSPLLDNVMKFITRLGDMGMVWIIISVYVIVFMGKGLIGMQMLCALAVTTFIGEGIIKRIFQRKRPCDTTPTEEMIIKKPLGYSFPSGHTASSFAVMTIMIVFFKSTAIIWITLAVLIGISRIYVHVHYPTDVVVGAILGVICARIVLYMFTVV